MTTGLGKARKKIAGCKVWTVAGKNARNGKREKDYERIGEKSAIVRHRVKSGCEGRKIGGMKGEVGKGRRWENKRGWGKRVCKEGRWKVWKFERKTEKWVKVKLG